MTVAQRHGFAYVLVGALAFFVYVPALWCGFVEFDDPEYVYRNEVVRQGLTLDGIAYAFRSIEIANWSPLTLLSHQVDVLVFGLNPTGHHFTNLLLHALNSMILLGVLSRATRAFLPSVVVAALFAVHPLHVESVAWIAERKDVLSAFFALIAMRFYIAYANGPRPKTAYCATVIFFAAALLSKPMPVTLPFVFLLLDGWPLNRLAPDAQNPIRKIVHLVLEKVPFFVLSGASIAITLLVQSWAGATSTLPNLALEHRLANAGLSYWAYVGDVIWPVGLSPIYPHPRAGVSMVLGLIALGTLGAMTLVALLMWRKRGYITTGWLLFVGMLVPMIGFVQVGYQARADRYMYFPIIGLFIAFVWLFWSWAGDSTARLRILGVMSIALVVAFSAVTVWQIGFWRDSETLFQRALDVTEDNFFAHEELGMYRYREGELEQAEFHFRESLRLGPEAAALHSNLASILRNSGRPDEAFTHAQRAIEMAPEVSATHGNMGWIQRDLGLPNEAAQSFVRAMELDERNVGAYYGLAVLLLEAGRDVEARPYLETVLALDPNHEAAQRMLERISVDGV